MAYNPARKHRHLPEMTQELRRAGSTASLFFTPHLVPMRRGMIATISFLLSPESVGMDNAEAAESHIAGLLTDAYGTDPFIRLTGQTVPSSRDVVGSNRCDIGWMVADAGDDGDGGCMVYLFSALDNLVKGAAGQAVQNFNLRFGFPETSGLPLRGEV